MAASAGRGCLEAEPSRPGPMSGNYESYVSDAKLGVRRLAPLAIIRPEEP